MLIYKKCVANLKTGIAKKIFRKAINLLKKIIFDSTLAGIAFSMYIFTAALY